jgi:UPF0271 protein
MRIDLNADVGESFGAYAIGDDAGVMPWITSANIAAGFHAGDASVLRRTIRLAREHGVAVGAHPGFPDLPGFGRRELRVDAADAEDFVLYQIAAVAGVAAAEGVALRHVKPHGALYNMAARDAALAAAIARATAAFDLKLVLFGLFGSKLLEEGRKAGLRVAAEVFADRAYDADGSLVPRDRARGVLEDDGEVVQRVIRMVTRGTVLAIDGAELRVSPDTICIHGDTPGAGARTARLRRELEASGISILPPTA